MLVKKRPITAPYQKRDGSAEMNSKTFNKHLCCLDRLELRKPRLRQAAKRYQQPITTMRISTFILTFIFFTNLLFGQNDERIKKIRKTVEKINNDTNYTIKKLDNTYFVDQKNEVTDGGQELSGYYKNGQLRKIIYYIGISMGVTTYEYYFAENQLIFVFQKQYAYTQVKELELQSVFEGRYYFENEKLFETKKKGKELFVYDSKEDKENKFLKDSKSFIEQLDKANSN